MKYCADTWFVLEFFEKDERAGILIADAGEGKHQLIFPIVVVAESHKKLRQKGIQEYEIKNFFDSAETSSNMSIQMLDRKIATEAAQLALTFGTPLLDAIVAATCRLTSCDFLLSGDEKHLNKLAKRRYIRLKNW